jgi:hypothetical protein
VSADQVRPSKRDEPDDRALFNRLVVAYRRGEVAIDIDAAALGHPHCPLSAQIFSIRAFYVILAVVGLSFAVFGYQAALGAAVGSLVLYWLVGRRLVHRKMRAFACAQITGSFELWLKMWRFGAITLSRESAEGPVHCRAPEQSWRAFARDCET